MADKILFWLDGDVIQFCLAYYLQKNYSGGLFAITDITDKPKKFFKEQKFVKFVKNWFYHDHIKTTKNADLKYLENFQKKYDIDLLELANHDRILNKYNEYYVICITKINFAKRTTYLIRRKNLHFLQDTDLNVLHIRLRMQIILVVKPNFSV